SFGTDGQILTAAAPSAALMLPDGRFLITSRVSVQTSKTDKLYLSRYNADGTLDKSFAAGKGTLLLSKTAVAGGGESLQVTAAGKIVVALNEYHGPLVVQERNADGGSDASFGPDGSGQILLTGTAGATDVFADGEFIDGLNA